MQIYEHAKMNSKVLGVPSYGPKCVCGHAEDAAQGTQRKHALCYLRQAPQRCLPDMYRTSLRLLHSLCPRCTLRKKSACHATESARSYTQSIRGEADVLAIL